MLALVGAVNVPIIYFSVQWWNTLHQGASVSLTAAPTMAAMMLTGMLLMTLAAWFYAIAVALARVRAIILERERGAAWVGRSCAGGRGRAMSVANSSPWAATASTSGARTRRDALAHRRRDRRRSVRGAARDAARRAGIVAAREPSR